jgi:hypothetical protein
MPRADFVFALLQLLAADFACSALRPSPFFSLDQIVFQSAH